MDAYCLKMNDNFLTQFLGKPWTVIGRAASLYTDPFIMLSGLLTTYSFVGRLRRTGALDIKNEYLSRLLRYGCVSRSNKWKWKTVLFTHNVLGFRLVPTLGALILFCTYIMPHIGSGPQWPLVVTNHAEICKRTWWRNFLFIHNYFGFENMVGKTRGNNRYAKNKIYVYKLNVYKLTGWKTFK